MLYKSRHLWSHDTAQQKTQQASLAKMSDMNKSTTICHIAGTKCLRLWGLPEDSKDEAVGRVMKLQGSWGKSFKDLHKGFFRLGQPKQNKTSSALLNEEATEIKIVTLGMLGESNSVRVFLSRQAQDPLT